MRRGRGRPRGSRFGPLACALAVGGSLDAGTGRQALAAGPGPPVELSFEGCPDSLTAPVERIARIELHAPVGRAGVATRIGLECSGEDEARLTVDDPVTSKRVERTVSLAGIPDGGRARLLALAIAELVRSSWLELDLQAAPALPPKEPVDVGGTQRDDARRVAVEKKSRPPWQAYAAIDGLILPTVGAPVLGLALGVRRELPRALVLDAALDAWDGVTERSTGSVAVRQVAFDPSLGLHLSIVVVDVGLRGGWVSLAGSGSSPSHQGRSTSGLFFGPMAGATVGVVGPLEVSLRTGWLLQGVRGVVAGDSDVLVGGYWASLGIGLRIGG